MHVVEFTDAMCSWAWGTEPKLRLLHWRFDDQIDEWRYVMGHLVEDEHMADRDRVADAPGLTKYWKVVCDQTGMPRPNLERSTAGSRASGLAVKAAQRQSQSATESVLRRMREATFVHGTPPDTPQRALEACSGATEVNHEALAADMDSTTVAEAYAADGEETRNPNEYVLNLEGDRPGIGRARESRDGRMRFVFPTLVIGSDAGQSTVPGWMPYEDYERAMFLAGAAPTERTRSRPTPEEAFDRWPSMAAYEFAFLCGDEAEVPSGTRTHTWDGGTVYFRDPV